jgi:UDP-glucose 4-epimerase
MVNDYVGKNDIMKILITGGAGFIGSAVIRELQTENKEIYVVDNLSFGNREFISIPDNRFINEDIRHRERILSIFEEIQPDWVIHLAAIHFIPYCNENPFESSNINVQGTINVLDAVQHTSSVKKVFFASTAAVYPIFDSATREDHRVDPLDVYGLSKLVCEHLMNEFHLKTGITSVICRFFNAFGPNETNPHLIPEIQDQINAGKREISLGNLEPKRDFIHTYDMARAVRMLMEKFDSGIEIFNLGRGIEYSVVEIVEAFARQLGEEVKIVQDPNRMRQSDRLHLLADVSKLKNYTGWEPEWGIDEGIKTLITR